MSEGILVVTKGMPQIRISVVDESVDYIDPNLVYIKFVPWETDGRGVQWGMLNLTPEFFDSYVATKPNIRDKFNTFEKMVSYFDKDPNFFFADPMNTGAKYASLGAYNIRLAELKEQFQRLFEKAPEKLTCAHEGCNMQVGLDENALCRHHREK